MDKNMQNAQNDISNEMICSIASMAALGVEGIEKMFMRISDEILDAIYPSAVSKGVKVVERDDGYQIDLHVITGLGINVKKVCEESQRKVKESVEIMSGRPVAEVNILVKGCGKYE
jgi:uncharacterized alkaline shock family protein YloU